MISSLLPPQAGMSLRDTYMTVAFMTCLIYALIIFAIPKVSMSIILGKLVKKNSGFNKMFRIERPTHESRVVVLPSPDFLYSVMGVDLTDPFAAIRIKAPSSEYASLGIYNSSAKCTDIISHAEAKLYAVIVGVNNTQSRAEIITAMKKVEGKSVKRNPPQIYRMASETGLLLHRILIPDPSNYEEYKLRQSMITADKINLAASCSCAVKNPWIRRIMLAVLLFGLLWITSSRLDVERYRPLMKQLAVMTVFSAFFSSIAAYFTVKLLKNPKYAGKLNLTKSDMIGSWSFHLLKSEVDMSGFKCILNFHRYLLVDLVTFLHGALGLLPSEVIYGTAITDSDGMLLEYGATYVITVPTLYLLCQWWSLTLYGSDLFLIPNSKEIYSVNSMQLEQIMKILRDTSGSSDNKPLRVICAPEPPSDDPTSSTYGVFWIPLPARPDDEQAATAEDTYAEYAPSGRRRISARAAARAPRLCLRVYRPIGEDWVHDFQQNLCPTVTRVYQGGEGNVKRSGSMTNVSFSSEALVNSI